MHKLSILIPVYNVKDYLPICLDSVLAQTMGDFEAICIDDGSTDGSGVILDDYQKKDDRIKVIHKVNEGYGKTMNLALSMATGTYVGIVEPDDAILPKMYESHVEDMDKYNLDFLKTDFFLTWHLGDGTLENEYYRLSEQEDLYERVLCPNECLETYFFDKFTWNGVYRRDFLINNNVKYNETKGASYQDNGFWFQTMYHANRMMFRKQSFYMYTKDNENASSWSKGKVDAFKNEYDYIRDYLLKTGEKRSEFYQIVFHWRLMGYLVTLYRIDASYREQYEEDIIKECRKYEMLKEAEYKWMPEWYKNNLDLIKNKTGIISKELNQKERRLREAIFNKKKIIVYGAGVRGKKYLWDLTRIKQPEQTICVAVSNLDPEKKYCLSFEVQDIRCVSYDRSDDVVILAVKPNTNAYYEMKNYLSQIGIDEVYEEIE